MPTLTDLLNEEQPQQGTLADLTTPAGIRPRVKESGYVDAALTGLVQGGAGLVSGAGAASEWAGDVLDSPGMRNVGKTLQGVAQKVTDSPVAKLEGPAFEGTFMENPGAKKVVNIVGQALPSLAAALATGGGTAVGLRSLGVAAPTALRTGSAVAAGGLGAVEGAPQYLEAKKAGKSTGEASAIGAAATLGTAALEYIGLGSLLKGAGKGILKGAGKGIITEGAQEGTQQLWQNLVAKVGYDDTRSLLEGMAEAIIGGAGAGGIAGAVTGRQTAVKDRATGQMLTKVLKAPTTVDDGIATVTTPNGVIKAPVDRISKVVAAGVTPDELAVATSEVARGVDAVQKQRSINRLPDDPTLPNAVLFNVKGKEYAYAPKEGMSREDLEAGLVGKSPGLAFNWLKKNAVQVPLGQDVKKTDTFTPSEQQGPDYTESAINDTLYDFADQATAVQDDANARLRRNQFEELKAKVQPESAPANEPVQMVQPGPEQVVDGVRGALEEEINAAVNQPVVAPVTAAVTRDVGETVAEGVQNETAQTPLLEPAAQAAQAVSPDLSYDGEGIGLHSYTVQAGPAKGASFSVATEGFSPEKVQEAYDKVVSRFENRAPSASEAPAASAPQGATPKTYDEAQEAIDIETDRLLEKYSFNDILNAQMLYGGTDWTGSQAPTTTVPKAEVQQLIDLYKIRDSIGNTELNAFIDKVVKDSRLGAEEVTKALESIGITKGDLGVATTSEALNKFGTRIPQNLAAMYRTFSKDTLAEFRWGGTADKPELEGSVFDEDSRPSGWEQKALAKTEAVYNAIATNRGMAKINLGRISKPAAKPSQGATSPTTSQVSTVSAGEVRPTLPASSKKIPKAYVQLAKDIAQVIEEDGVSDDFKRVPSFEAIAAYREKFPKDSPDMVMSELAWMPEAEYRALTAEEEVTDLKQDRAYSDPPAAEASAVQQGIEGKSTREVLQFLIENAPSPAHRLVAGKVGVALMRLEEAGMKTTVNVAHLGENVPAHLAGARGASSTFFGKEPRVEVWLNGADVTGKSGMSYEVVLHELIHAATQGALHIGKKTKGTSKFNKDAADLLAVTSRIMRHANARIAAFKAGTAQLTDFEMKLYRANGMNALANENEVLAWALSNSEMQTYLDGIKIWKTESLWSRFVTAVRNFLGLEASSDSALSEVLRVGESLLDVDAASLLDTLNGNKNAQRQTTLNKMTIEQFAQDALLSVKDAGRKIQNLPAFRKWFAGSKVVDENGKPLVVYHGTNNGFSSFAEDMKSSKTGNPNAQLGYFFTENPDEASRYAEVWGKQNGRVIPVYLSISNPYEMGYAEFNKLSMGAWSRITEKSTKQEILQAHEAARADALARRDELIAEGYDGVITKVGGVTEYVAFEPTQIKSIFNSTWDGDNPDILFYKADEVLSKSKDAIDSALTAIANPKRRLHSFWLQHADKVFAFTPLSHLAQTYGKDIHWIKDLSNHGNELESTTTRLVDDFFAIHERAVEAAEKENGVDGLNEAMLKATFNQMDPTKPLKNQDWVKDGNIVEAGKAWSKAGMKKATGKTFIEAYNAAAEAYKALGPKSQAEMVNMAQYLVKLREMDRDSSMAFINAVAPEEGTLRTALMSQFNTSFSTIKGMYFPLSRYGKFILKFKMGDGREVSETFETVQEAYDARLKAVANGADEESIAITTQDEVPRESVVIPPELLNQLRESIAKQYMAGVDPNDASAKQFAEDRVESTLATFNQTVLRWLPDTAALKNSIHRKSTLGANPNMLRSVNGYVQSHASRIAWATVGKKLEQDIDGFAAENKEMLKNRGNVDLVIRGHLLNTMRKWLNAVHKERIGKFASIVGKFNTGFYMTSPSTFLVQLTQLPTLTLPHLAARYGSIPKALAALKSASADAFSRKFTKDAMRSDDAVNAVYEMMHRKVSYKDTVPNKDVGENFYSDQQLLREVNKLSADQKKLLALREAEALNLLDISAAHEANDVAQGKRETKIGAALHYALMPMKYGELGARKAAILATFDLASTRGDNFFKAMEETRDVIDKTIYNFSVRDKGWMMQKSILRVPFTFQTYRIKTALRLGLLMRDSIKAMKEQGLSKGMQDQATKEFVGIMMTSSMLAGTLGMPFAGTAIAILNLILGDDDEPVDAELMYTNWLREQTGSELAGDVAAYGMFSLLGMNLSRRIGMGDMFGAQSSPPESLHGAGLAAWWAGNLIGPAFSVGQGWFQGYDEIVNKGNYLKGLEAATPKPIKDALKAYRVATEGLKTGQGKRLLFDDMIGPDEIVLVGLGFNADEIAKAQTAERSLQTISTRISERRGKLIRQAAQAFAEGDDASPALENIRKFNRSMPRFAINGGDIRPAIRKILVGDIGTTGLRETQVAAQFEVPSYVR